MPERVIAEQPPAAKPEPSMFDSPEWMGNIPTAAPSKASFAGVRFQRVGKIYHYLAGGFSLKLGDWVVVDTARGKQMAQVASLKPPRDFSSTGGFKRIERMVTGRDMAMRHFYESKELEAMIACRAESNALALPIKIVKAEYSFDGQTLTFMFSSDQEEHVETNDLRQVMSRLYRARIETRQISPREVAKIIGGMGACGIEQRCCSRFLTEFSPVSIKHAKEQGLSLNPHDITGMCGRLRCCLIYEYEQYVEARRQLPKRNSIVGTPHGQGKVVDILALRDSVAVLIGEGETAKEFVVHREEIIPLEELKRLQEKAASGTCDKHEGGGCDCGKGKQASKDADPQASAAPPAVAPAPPAEVKPQRSGGGGGSRNRQNEKQRSGAQPAQQKPAAQEQRNRHADRPRHQRQAERRPDANATPRNTDNPSAPPQDDDSSKPPGQQNRPVRRPLRRPPPRKPQ